ncbi:hypothetical protein AFM11_05210 [Mycolicibacterium wolinskyi]|uniref:Uncharacterized protein n=1 Tax=Mycolicibacterium wolinskyi TaxID=59750 RepID=A0A132PTV2_9MYCO|nr:hypothetical protein [Mycolicibacterium wolinskyi]KWX25627.1 hypothetical protein AFM11_05210 [Mycolicibacterium wolinskyi]
MTEIESADAIDEMVRAAQERSNVAYRELKELRDRAHTDEEEEAAELKAAESGYYLALAQAHSLGHSWMADFSRGAQKETLERSHLAVTIKQWQVDMLRVEVQTQRAKVAERAARAVTESNLKAANESARAARWTAYATIVLAVATVVLIVATLIAAKIASGGGG